MLTVVGHTVKQLCGPNKRQFLHKKTVFLTLHQVSNGNNYWYSCNIFYNSLTCILECFCIFFSRNAPEESYEYEDDYKETDQLLDDEGRTEESEGNSSTQRKQKKKKKPSLSKILWSLFGINFAIAVLCKLLHDILLFVQPQLLK